MSTRLVFCPPPCKSAFQRAAFLGLLEPGRTRLSVHLPEFAPGLGRDARAALRVVNALGAEVIHELTGPGMGDIVIQSHGWVRPSGGSLACGESATTARFVLALLAGLGGDARLEAEPQLARREVGDSVVHTLESLGCDFDWMGEPGCFPMRIASVGGDDPLDLRIDTSHTSQAASGLLMVLARRGGRLVIDGPPGYAPLTAAWLRRFGVALEMDVCSRHAEFFVTRNLRESDRAVFVPGDPSAASFFLAWSASCGVSAEVRGLGDLRDGPEAFHPDIGFLGDLEAIGVSCQHDESALRIDPARGSVPSSTSAASPIDLSDRPDCVAPLVALLSTLPGRHALRSAKLRHKESDRLTVLARGLRLLGFAAVDTGDTLVFEGRVPQAQPETIEGTLETAGDHRMAMAFATLASIHRLRVRLDDEDCVDKSFPGFHRELRRWEAARRTLS
ncbi:MAG: hypothetical protein KDC95_07005 [Planctomycetes bacterium]|nr:hypothetical protein [Planctomycetota bacterium]